jgi:hypothetical protein
MLKGFIAYLAFSLASKEDLKYPRTSLSTLRSIYSVSFVNSKRLITFLVYKNNALINKVNSSVSNCVSIISIICSSLSKNYSSGGLGYS